MFRTLFASLLFTTFVNDPASAQKIPGISPVGEVQRLHTNFAFTEGPAAGSDGNLHRLSDYAGQHVVIAFFPKAFTGG